MLNGRLLGVSVTLILLASTIASSTASATPIKMPTLSKEIAQQQAIVAAHKAINPPAPPCPETGMLPEPLSNCGLPEAPATTLPYPGNMAYWGGHVQVVPQVYIVYLGWGRPGAFTQGAPCKPEALKEGLLKARLKCDPDGAGARMADFVQQMGGTEWAAVSTQFFQTAADGSTQSITNPTDVLAGLWVDDSTNGPNLAGTSAANPPGPGNTYTDLASEAARAVKHFHITDLANADIVIAQPPGYSDPNALESGYCAFHDYTQPGLEGGIYNGIESGIAYTNMPYSLAINSTSENGESSNDCGENAVNSGSAGKLDGFSIVLGHELEETITDPGAEDILGSGTSATKLGGWYDTIDANENGDKCAWVGEPLTGPLPGAPNVVPIPGAMGDIKGNADTTFAVQSLWSNEAAAGTGFCAGAGTDLPL
jgi:hypothetical protein